MTNICKSTNRSDCKCYASAFAKQSCLCTSFPRHTVADCKQGKLLQIVAELTMTHPLLWRRSIASIKACYIVIALVECRCKTLPDVTMLTLTACGKPSPGIQVAKGPGLLTDQFTKGALARHAPFGSRQPLYASHSRVNICSVQNLHSPTLTEFAKGSLKRCCNLLAACLLTGLLSACPVQAVATITDTIQASNLVVGQQPDSTQSAQTCVCKVLWLWELLNLGLSLAAGHSKDTPR